MNLLILISSFLLAFIGCEVPTGPKADVDANHADGRYIMTGLIDITKGRAIPVGNADGKRYLQVKSILVNSVNNVDSSFINSGFVFYNKFSFFDSAEKETSTIKAIRWTYNYDDKRVQEHQWFHIDDNTGLLAVLEFDYSRGVTTRVMLSNVMKSSSYQADLDTIRYIYRPKFH